MALLRYGTRGSRPARRGRGPGSGRSSATEDCGSRPPLADERGFTAIETTIVLIAFVTLAAMFAYTVMTTGILSSERSREAVMGGLDQTTRTMMVSGPVVGHANADNTAIDLITFQVITASRGAEGVYVSADNMVITYVDADQVVHLTPDDWTATWLMGFGPLLNPGERVEISVDLRGLDPRLGPAKRLSIQLVPDRGTVLTVERTTPKELGELVDLV